MWLEHYPPPSPIQEVPYTRRAQRVCLTIHHNSVWNKLNIVCTYPMRVCALTTTGNIDRSRRKRIRCDSDPKGGHQSSQKVYKGRNDIDTDSEMEGLVSSANSSPLSSPTQGTCPESSSTNVKGSRTLSSPLPTWKRDDHFYLEDGSCVLLVGDTLFNVELFAFLAASISLIMRYRYTDPS